MGVVCGLSGTGKTTAIAHLVAQTNSTYVCGSPNWTPTSMLADICVALGLAPVRIAKQMEDAVVERLAMGRKALFIDEADFFWSSDSGTRLSKASLRMLETLRSIHDRAMVPVVLIGMEDLERKLAYRQQLDSRIAQRIRFQPCDVHDAKVLAETCCEITLSDDLVSELYMETVGNIRRLLVVMANLEKEARTQGWESINLAQFRQVSGKKGGKSK